jgi:hypothetical protein
VWLLVTGGCLVPPELALDLLEAAEDAHVEEESATKGTMPVEMFQIQFT